MRRDLVQRAMAHDHEAFSELARLSIDKLYVIARLILRDTDRAQDATQDALVLAWRDIAALRDGPVVVPANTVGLGSWQRLAP